MEPSKDAQEALQSIYNLAVTDLNDGSNFDSIVDELVTKGLNKEAALTIVTKAADDLYEAKCSRSNRNIGFGCLWFFGGLIVTLATMSGGGRFILAYGAIIGGFIQLIAGIVQRPSRYY